jgi:hypothetical protein
MKMVDKAQTPPVEGIDNFATAFEQLLELGDKPVPDSTTLGINETEEEKAAREAAEAAALAAKAEEEAPVEAEETTNEEEVEEKPAKAAKPGEIEPDDAALLSRFAKVMRNSPAEPEQTAQIQQVQAPVQYFNEEEAAFLTAYEKDYPDVARAEQLRTRAAVQHAVQYVFSELFSPLANQMREMATGSHLQQLEEAVPDYHEVVDEVIAWAKAQPAYLQPAYNHVINEGTADEIQDLIGKYRQATGTAAAAPVVRQKVTELPASTKQAVASLAPVSSKRTVVVQATDPSDYNGAFKDFASMGDL